VGEAEVVEPRMPRTAEEVKNLTDDELHLVFALSHATEIRAVVDDGDNALRAKVESWNAKGARKPGSRPRRGRLNSLTI
jgi:hypothetical protein